MKYLLLSGLFLSLSSLCLAQNPKDEIQKRLKDPNIVWMAEAYLDLEDLHSSHEGRNEEKKQDRLFSNRQHSRSIKRQTASPNTDWEVWLNEAVVKNLRNIYQDANLEAPMAYGDFERQTQTIDTIFVFDQATYQQTIQVVVNDFNPANIKAYRLRILLCYDIKQKRLQSLPLAIAPLYFPRGQNTLQPLFWLAISQQQTLMDAFKSPDLPLIRSIEYTSELSQYQELKNKISRDSMLRHFGDQLWAERAKIFANFYNDLDDKPLNSQELDQCLVLRDTVQIFGEDGKIRDTILAQKIFTGESLSHLRLTYWIGWNEHKEQFILSPYSMALAYTKKDDLNNPLAIMPLFYLYPTRWYK